MSARGLSTGVASARIFFPSWSKLYYRNNILVWVIPSFHLNGKPFQTCKRMYKSFCHEVWSRINWRLYTKNQISYFISAAADWAVRIFCLTCTCCLLFKVDLFFQWMFARVRQNTEFDGTAWARILARASDTIFSLALQRKINSQPGTFYDGATKFAQKFIFSLDQPWQLCLTAKQAWRN